MFNLSASHNSVLGQGISSLFSSLLKAPCRGRREHHSHCAQDEQHSLLSIHCFELMGVDCRRRPCYSSANMKDGMGLVPLLEDNCNR